MRFYDNNSEVGGGGGLGVGLMAYYKDEIEKLVSYKNGPTVVKNLYTLMYIFRAPYICMHMCEVRHAWNRGYTWGRRLPLLVQ